TKARRQNHRWDAHDAERHRKAERCKIGRWGTRNSVSMTHRALVVDDDPLLLELIASMLAELGCDTVTARSGRDALGRLASVRSTDLFFADINMPGLWGVELAERARDFRPGLRVLLVSGRESDAPGFPLLRKPFSQSDLRRAMTDSTGLCDLSPAAD